MELANLIDYRKIDPLFEPLKIYNLINNVYKVSENGLWNGDVKRVGLEEVKFLISENKLLGAFLGNEILGVIKYETTENLIGQFGMLAVHANYRGQGIGKKLIYFAENSFLDCGCNSVQFYLLVPACIKHPDKEFLKKWYTTIGYVKIGKALPSEIEEELATKLKHESIFEIYEKKII